MECILAAMVAKDKASFNMESTLLNLIVAIAAFETCVVMPASYWVMLECMTSAWPPCARHDGVGSGSNGDK